MELIMKTIKRAKSTKPSILVSRLLVMKAYRRAPAKNMNGQLRLIVCGATGMGNIITVIAKTSAMLAIFDPITFPSAISGCPVTAAPKLTINSGAEVPKATIVRPITNDEILK